MRLKQVLLLLALQVGVINSLHAQGPALSVAPDSAATAQAHKKLRSAALRIAIPSAIVGIGIMAHTPTYSSTLCQVRHKMQAETQAIFGKTDFRGVDDYSRHLPLVTAYGLMATGHRGERTPLAFTLIYVLAHELDGTVVSNLKRVTAQGRPFNENVRTSFPSSHTSQAFLTATLLHEQYGRQYPWVSVTGYAMATATGTMRFIGNKHWVTDVMAGAAIGFLSAETVWHLYPALTKLLPQRLAQKMLLVPTYTPGAGAGMLLAASL
jgi:membrane-associated phospholipid phosphatase